MLVFQYFDRWDNAHYSLVNDYRDVIDQIYGLENLNDYQAQKAAKGFEKWFSQISYGKVCKFSMPSLKFNVFVVLDDFYKPARQRYQMHNEYILNNVLLSYVSGRKCSIPIYNDNVWTIEISFSERGALQFWVAYELRDGTYRSSQVTVVQACKCLSDFEMKKAVSDKILSVYKCLALNNLLDR